MLSIIIIGNELFAFSATSTLDAWVKIIALSSSISLFAVKLEIDGRRLIGECIAYREGRA